MEVSVQLHAQAVLHRGNSSRNSLDMRLDGSQRRSGICILCAFTLGSCSAYFSTWKRRGYVPPKRRQSFSRLHSVIFQKIRRKDLISLFGRVGPCIASPLSNGPIQSGRSFCLKTEAELESGTLRFQYADWMMHNVEGIKTLSHFC
jgi:hypothetical protein